MSTRDYKKDFPVFERFARERKPFVYLDSAATAQAPRAALDAVRRHFESSHANPHRGIYALSEAATAAYEDAREAVRAFINAPAAREIVFTRNTTEGINAVASSLAAGKFLAAGDRILVGRAEHHSNFLPWQRLRDERGVVLDIADVGEEGRLDTDEIERLIRPETKLAAFAHVSHVLGTVNPIRELAAMFRKQNVLFLVDAAQSAAHLPLDVRDIGCDFLAFSGHKLGAPMGAGVLWGRGELLEKMPPAIVGGGMIREVREFSASWEDIPHKFEAGTPNVAGAVALAAAVRYIADAGLDAIRENDRAIAAWTLRVLGAFPDIRVFGPRSPDDRAGLVSFHIPGVHPHDLASILDEAGVAIRAGHQCAMPLHERLGVPASARASFWIYNTPGDAEALGEGIERVLALLKHEQ